MIKTSPTEDPLNIRIGITGSDFETLRDSVDFDISVGAIAVYGGVQRHDGAVLGALNTESADPEPDTDLHYFDLNVPNMRQIRLRLIYAMSEWYR